MKICLKMDYNAGRVISRMVINYKLPFRNVVVYVFRRYAPTSLAPCRWGTCNERRLSKVLPIVDTLILIKFIELANMHFCISFTKPLQVIQRTYHLDDRPL